MLSKNEVKLGGIQGLHQLMVRLLSGCDSPVMEYMHLLVKHIYFKQCEIVVRKGKGEKDRLMMLPVLGENDESTDCYYAKQQMRAV